MSPVRADGIIRFEQAHRRCALDARATGKPARELLAWREILFRLGLLGRDPSRYAGLGFGNVSVRLAPFRGVPRGRRRFLVSGSQTGGRRALSSAGLCVVECWDLGANRVESAGPVPPSSEALAHGAVYDALPAARAVLHAHAPGLWRAARALGVPVTAPGADAGTVALALEVGRLCRSGAAAGGLIALGGHPDGVLAFGTDADAAGATLVRALARALAAGARR